MEPKPLIVFTDFGNSALEFLFGLWFYKTDYLALKNSIMQEIKEAFDANDIEIPFPGAHPLEALREVVRLAENLAAKAREKALCLGANRAESDLDPVFLVLDDLPEQPAEEVAIEAPAEAAVG